MYFTFHLIWLYYALIFLDMPGLMAKEKSNMATLEKADGDNYKESNDYSDKENSEVSVFEIYSLPIEALWSFALLLTNFIAKLNRKEDVKRCTFIASAHKKFWWAKMSRSNRYLKSITTEC